MSFSNFFKRADFNLQTARALQLFSNPVGWVILLTVVGGVIRRYHLAAKSLWVDETMLYHFSQGNVWEILYKNAKMSSAPPLYPYLLRAVQIFGDSEVVLRGLAMGFSILSIPLTYYVFRRFLTSGAALFSTGLVAIAPSQIVYAQQVREYSLTYLLSLGMLLTAFNYRKEPSWRNLIGLMCVWVVAIWTQYGLAVMALGLNIAFGFFWLRNRNRQDMYRWMLGQIPVVASVLMVYVLALRYQFVPGGSGIQYLAVGYWDPTTQSLWNFIGNQSVDLLKFTFPDPILFPMLLSIGFVSAWFTPQKRGLFVWIFSGMGVAILLGVLRMYPYLGSRHDLYLAPLLFLLGGLGFEYLLQVDHKLIIAGILMVFLVVSGIQANIIYFQSPGMENTRPILSQLKANLQPEDRIYVYYSAEGAFRYYLRDQSNATFIGKAFRGTPEKYLSEINPLIQVPGRIWLVFSHCFKNECNLIRDHVNLTRPVELVAENPDVWLYLVH